MSFSVRCLWIVQEEQCSQGCDCLLVYCRASICREAEMLKKYPFVLKIAPLNPQARTYYVSFGSKGELDVRILKRVCVCVIDYPSISTEMEKGTRRRNTSVQSEVCMFVIVFSQSAILS